MINLFISYFTHPNSRRQAEIDQCLLFNLNNNYIDKIYCIIDNCDNLNDKIFTNPKIEKYFILERPTYNTFFELANKVNKPNDISIISNSDIYFDETLTKLPIIMTFNRALALTRWNVNLDRIDFFNRDDSQDCWIFKGQIKEIDGSFQLGRAGCDNRIAYEIKKAGYEILNPSRTIKAYHLHSSNIRDYIPKNAIQPPYLKLLPI